VGDLVTSTLVSNGEFFGVVRDVQHKLNKVMVAWGGGSLCQHDPEEIQLSVHQDDTVKSRWASTSTRTTRRGRLAMEPEEANADPQYVGDPKVNGLDNPRDGGFSIMQDLSKEQAKESLEQSSENPKVSPIQGSTQLKSRRAIYWCGPGRTYKMTKVEVACGTPRCPKCCGDMGKHNFTRNANLFICDDCGFKISSDKVLTEKPVVEAVPAEPQVTVASVKSRRQAR
jgi:hypothetical protein